MSKLRNDISVTAAAGLAAGAIFASSPAFAQSLEYASSADRPFSFFGLLNSNDARNDARAEETRETAEIPANLRRHVVTYNTREAPGTVIIDTTNTQLYYVLGSGKAISYGIGVGRDGFTWSGVQTIARKAEWPDWIPPTEMIQRQPYLPRFMAGGPGNPLGARALYLGSTAFRIHGTNAPETIGQHVSSGCIRMVNDDVIDLYGFVGIGNKVIVLPDRLHLGTRHVEDRQLSSDKPPRTVRAFGLY
jgi:lipoprotein-anchoring transpeptidase ErfK/SrfK